MDEYITFWVEVRQSGTPEKTVLAELKTLHQRLSLFKDLNRLSNGDPVVRNSKNEQAEPTPLQRTFTQRLNDNNIN